MMDTGYNGTSLHLDNPSEELIKASKQKATSEIIRAMENADSFILIHANQNNHGVVGHIGSSTVRDLFFASIKASADILDSMKGK